MSSLKIVVVLLSVVSLLLMQVDLGLAKKSFTVNLKTTPIKNNALSASVINTLTGLTTTITLGIPRTGDSQAYLVLIDTGKTDLWLVDQSCRDIYCITRNTAQPAYSSAARLTFYDLRKSLTSSYLENRYQITGIVGLEQMTLVDSANAGADPPVDATIVYNQEFIRVRTTKGFTSGDAYSGFLGLGNQAPGTTIPTRASVLDRLVDQGIIDSKKFTIQGAALTFGDLPTLGGAVNYVNVVSKGIWDFRASLVTLDDGLGTPTTVARNVVIRIETLLSNIAVPSAQLKTIATRLGGRQNPITKEYVVACGIRDTNTLNLVLTINNQIYQIPPASYINAVNAAGACTLNLLETKSSWILGQTFLPLYATVYDATTRKIGFATNAA